ncbi:MAG: hypothetical protein M3441_05880 [Chloroflexota bacterium]|nr:hypothetical protein [Chloroflexota bacterium]
MDSVEVTINSSRKLQKEIEHEFQAIHPDIELNLIVGKSFDLIQTTGLVIASATLLVEFLSLVLELRKKHPNSKVLIELKSKGGKTLKIDATNQDFDVDKIVSDFYNDNTLV